MKNLYVVMGGLGKALLWTSLIPSLCEKDEVEKISVMSPWPWLFEKHNQIEGHEPLLDFNHIVTDNDIKENNVIHVSIGKKKHALINII